MLAEAIMDHNEIKIIKYPKNKFKGNHWKLKIESVEEIKDNSDTKQFSYIKKDPMNHLSEIKYNDDMEDLSDVKLYNHIDDSAKYIHNLRRERV